MQRKIGDVLVSFESEAELIAREFGKGEFEVVYPSLSILTEFPVAIVDKVVDKKGTRKLAQAYLDYLYSSEGQSIAARHYYRPRDSKVLEGRASPLPKVHLFTLEEIFGSWSKAQKEHFSEGGSFDRIFIRR